MKRELELYIHIPFCVKKCAYCDFLSAPADEETCGRYVDALVQEIETYRESQPDDCIVTTIFFGGGTPSILTVEQMSRVMRVLSDVFTLAEDAEISIEANPGTVTREKLETYRQLGVNRISFGLQSTDKEVLQILGRIHSYEEFVESYQLARECGFDNINVDLMSAIPKQTIASWERDLARVVALQPEHISAYSLIIEDNTPFAQVYGEGAEGERELPTEEEERQIYRRTKEVLEAAGYHRYEISNYAKAGKECKHNLGYWERKNYLGLGLGAASLLDNVRFKNTDSLSLYLEKAKQPKMMREDREELSMTEQMEETVFLGLRKMQGLAVSDIRKQYGRVFEIRYGENVKRMEAEGMVLVEDDYLKLSENGIDVSNYVFAEILR
ncbi:MAG: radical SAM family heme chaperone HemW [Faecalimonas sp.]|nr:radical SAM family heme chaperone HemW [Faecalimonas sp.]